MNRLSKIIPVETNRKKKEKTMLWTITVVLVILWVLGLVSSYTMGGFIHILLVLAVITVLFQIIRGRKTS
ncbi:lmo0937 family membrane protein [uncultured Desulfobacter sp.]|uniref:lmo0937 family membrane protein n=1 Tax=uncultured Desulfobacter sp. TaxID=240139 RepID=UPI002AAC214B|nr:lmo0937 family membrane protein [uncultured Desulfobacter sp.]